MNWCFVFSNYTEDKLVLYSRNSAMYRSTLTDIGFIGAETSVFIGDNRKDAMELVENTGVLRLAASRQETQ